MTIILINNYNKLVKPSQKHVKPLTVYGIPCSNGSTVYRVNGVATHGALVTVGPNSCKEVWSGKETIKQLDRKVHSHCLNIYVQLQCNCQKERLTDLKFLVPKNNKIGNDYKIVIKPL